MVEALDNSFLNYGIRHDDLKMIQALCQTEGFDFECLKENILREYHKKKVTGIEITYTDTEKEEIQSLNVYYHKIGKEIPSYLEDLTFLSFYGFNKEEQ